MGKTGKISSIKKEYDRGNISLEASLAVAGRSRFPGTGVRFVPYKENNGSYRTGLDVDALYMKRMKVENPENYKLEVARIKEVKADLEARSGVDLSPRSDYYTQIFNDKVNTKAEIIKLKEGDNVFSLDDVWAAITYEWLRVHPMIASSYQAYEKGEYPASTQFYVNDENVEETIKYRKKILVNRAVSALEGLSLEKRKKVARLLGLPVSDSAKEIVVYNLLDTFIKQSDIQLGEHKGRNPIDMFNKFAEMDDKLVTTKDLVDQAIKHSLYRVTKGRRITEGGQEIAADKEALVDFLLDPKNQDDLLALEDKLKSKKSIAIS